VWSQLHGDPDPDSRRAAFDYLVRSYWPPVYALYRRVYRVPPEQARDLTQGLFLKLMDGALDRADPARARFRTFLRVAAKSHFLDQKKRKRGDGAFAPADWALDMNDDVLEAPGGDPEEAFDRDFARCLVRQAWDAFAADCARRGVPGHAEIVRLRYLDPPEAGTRGLVAAIADAVGKTPEQTSRTLYKAKQAFRRQLLVEVRGTLTADADADTVEAEARALLAALGD